MDYRFIVDVDVNRSIVNSEIKVAELEYKRREAHECRAQVRV